MGRKARVFTAVELAEMVRLFNAGESTKRIGRLYGCSGQLIGKALKPRLGDLRSARAILSMRQSRARRRVPDEEYRQGFEAGYRMALTHVNLHGLEEARNHSNTSLLPWRDEGMTDWPPAFGELSE